MYNKIADIDLNSLLLFYEVVNGQSLRQASARLGVPKATVSRKLRDLERDVGAVLLKRGQQRLAVTDVGAALYEHCERIAAEVRDASLVLSDMQVQLRGSLRVSLPFGFGTDWISAAVAKFALQYPHVELFLQATHTWVDVAEDQFDVAVHVGKIRNEDLPVVNLGELSRGVYASADYCRTRGAPERPEDLLDFECVPLVSQREDGLWTFERNGRQVEVPARVTVTDVSIARQMALDGLGYAVLPNMICVQAVAEGRLRRVLPDWPIPPLRTAATFLERRYLPLRIRTFLDFIRKEMEPVKTVF